MRRVAALVSLLLSLVGARADGALPASPADSPFEYVVFARRDVRLRPEVRVLSGQVGANVGTVILGRKARVGDSVAAFTVRIADGSSARRYFCFFVDGSSKVQCRDLAIPLVADATLPALAVSPGSTDVRVARGRVVAPLLAGAYGRVKLGARAGLLLGGGTYTVRSLRLGTRAQLVCTAACTIQVLDRVALAGESELRAQASQGVKGLRVDVQGAGRAVFRSGAGARVTGTVYAPAGGVVLGAGGEYRGHFIGDTVTIGPGAQLTASDS